MPDCIFRFDKGAVEALVARAIRKTIREGSADRVRVPGTMLPRGDEELLHDLEEQLTEEASVAIANAIDIARSAMWRPLVSRCALCDTHGEAHLHKCNPLPAGDLPVEDGQ